eukprot:TRINITY_DN5560_c0_g1_i3.p1 TRINITY_DN5560_c0_g1~~TRINITY_DN5560_c0_g1_i3.p1  ORF type:complete len:136 (+),score=28.34 TRINITY_DN5560_c0_g1_i3:37-408(+)
MSNAIVKQQLSLLPGKEGEHASKGGGKATKKKVKRKNVFGQKLQRNKKSMLEELKREKESEDYLSKNLQFLSRAPKALRMATHARKAIAGEDVPTLLKQKKGSKALKQKFAPSFKDDQSWLKD